jgi:carboxylesterase
MRRLNVLAKYPCLLFHGFTGGPFEVQPLGDYLQNQGAVCEVPKLPWNGEDMAELESIHWTDWVESAEKHAIWMADTYGSFDLIGFSMGGLLAAYLASRYPVRRLILINASVVYVSPGRLLSTIREDWKYRDQEYFYKVKSTPLRAAWQFTRLVRHLKPELSNVTVPTFIAQSERDHVIHPLSARYIYEKVGGYRELRWYPRSKHLICHDEDAQHLFQEVSEFLEKE